MTGIGPGSNAAKDVPKELLTLAIAVPVGAAILPSEVAAIVATVLPAHEAMVLNTAADKLDALPPGGEALQGPQWHRAGISDAAGLLRDWADAADRAAEIARGGRA